MLQEPSKIILITGFAPFAGEKINPSWQIVKALPEMMAGYQIQKLQVPTEFGKSIKVVIKTLKKFQPQMVLCLGQAGGRTGMSVERVAINVDDAIVADNAGAQPIDQAIVSDAPTAYFCTVPIKAMVEEMKKKSVPAEISNTAGTFVCNHLLYGVLHHIALHQLKIRAGFMHVPYSDSQVIGRGEHPSLALEAMIEGTKAAITAAIKNRGDINIIGGKI